MVGRTAVAVQNCAISQVLGQHDMMVLGSIFGKNDGLSPGGHIIPFCPYQDVPSLALCHETQAGASQVSAPSGQMTSETMERKGD